MDYSFGVVIISNIVMKNGKLIKPDVYLIDLLADSQHQIKRA